MPSLRDFFTRREPEAATAAAPLKDEGGLFPPDDAIETVLLTAFGLDAETLGAALDTAASGFSAGARVVCLCDQADFLPLRRRKIAFEYMPAPAARSGFADASTWEAYLTERYEILLAKWRPDRIVAIGGSLEQFLKPLA